MGPAQAEISTGIQISAERLAMLLAIPYVQITECLVHTQYPSAEKLSPLYNRCHKDIFLTRQINAASS
ncbi:hypothetical protein V6N13_034056 [Hibiscus sabdariffa]